MENMGRGWGGPCGPPWEGGSRGGLCKWERETETFMEKRKREKAINKKLKYRAISERSCEGATETGSQE